MFLCQRRMKVIFDLVCSSANPKMLQKKFVVTIFLGNHWSLTLNWAWSELCEVGCWMRCCGDVYSTDGLNARLGNLGSRNWTMECFVKNPIWSLRLFLQDTWTVQTKFRITFAIKCFKTSPLCLFRYNIQKT